MSVAGVPGTAEDADDQVADGGQEAGCAAGADSGGVFAVGGVAQLLRVYNVTNGMPSRIALEGE